MKQVPALVHVNQLNKSANVKNEPQDSNSGLMDTSSGDVMLTLNRLNAHEHEVDVEGLSSDVKLEFGNATEEVAG